MAGKGKQKKRQNRSTTSTATTLPICTPSCSHSGEAAGEMVKCCLCMSWFHEACVSQSGDTHGIWNCDKCRNLPLLVESLMTQIADISQNVKVLQTTNMELVRALKDKTKESDDLCNKYKKFLAQRCTPSSSDNSSGASLVVNLPALSQESGPSRPPAHGPLTVRLPPVAESGPLRPPVHRPLTVRLPTVVENRPSQPPSSRPLTVRLPPVIHPHNVIHARPSIEASIIGTSITRGLGPEIKSDLIDTCVYVNPGCQIKHITKRITGMTHTHRDAIVLQTGSVDIITEDSNNTISHYNNLIEKTKSSTSHATTIFLSSIPLRRDNSQQSRACAINTYLRRRASHDHRLHFISNDNIQDKHIRRDGIHLTYEGTQLLAKNIQQTLESWIHAQDGFSTPQDFQQPILTIMSR